MDGRLRIGTSGWQYDHWRGVLYPADLPKSRWFQRYTEIFDTVEVNNTFYRLPSPETFEAWREQAPPGFCYALKYSRFGSHMKKLKDPEMHLPPFLDRARRLGAHLGPVLVQLPPRWRPDLGRLEGFLAGLPPDLRWVIEMRQPDWLCPEVLELLRQHRVALCLHDMLPEHPTELTTDLVYLRFHGQRYDGAYGRERLQPWAERIGGWRAEGLPVFVYFNNDLGGHAVRDALLLRELVAA